MREPKVEEFLAHTRLASEEDAKADFERRVDGKVEEIKYSDDEPRDDHGRWGEGGAGPTTAEHFASRIVRTLEAKPNHVMDAVQLRATVMRGVDSRFKSLYDQGHARLEGAEAIKLVPGVAYPSYALVPEKAQAFKMAAEPDLKYSDDQPRDDHGRFGVTGTDYEGEDANSGHLTRVEAGHLPLSAIASLRGARGEVPGQHRYRQGADWDSFKSDIARNGMHDPIFITKDWNKEAVISEGNHRRDAAVELGSAKVPVEIRYFGNAQKQGLVR